MPSNMRAQATALYLVCAIVANLVFAPQIVGWLSDSLSGPAGPEANSLGKAVLFLTPGGLLAAWHYFRSNRTIIEDERRALDS